MARILGIDYGLKRTGLAVTDPMQIIATGLTTIKSENLVDFLKTYFFNEIVEKIIIGYPLDLKGNTTHATPAVDNIIRLLNKEFANIPIEKVDERFTSRMASQTIAKSGLNKQKRQQKELIDKVSATIILQAYLEKNK